MVKWTNAGGQTKRANERSFVYSPPAWRRWRNVKTTYIDVVFFFFFYLINIQLKLRLKIAEPFSSDILFVTHNIKCPTSKLCLTNHKTVRRLGTLRSNDARATRTSLKKVNLRSFSLYSDYSYPLTLSIVGEPSWSWISRDQIQAQKEK